MAGSNGDFEGPGRPREDAEPGPNSGPAARLEAERVSRCVNQKVLPAAVILHLAFQSLGIVYGDLGASPLYLKSVVMFYAVLSAVSGIKEASSSLNDNVVTIVSLVIIVSLFSMQRFGTEALFADLGHFTSRSIQIAFSTVVYPSLLLAYLVKLYWPMFVLATLAAIIASQAIISATFSIVKQSVALGCFPRVKIVHTSDQFQGQIYIPEINWLLMILCLVITAGFRDTRQIGNAYGIAVVAVMLVTTYLMTLVMLMVWHKPLIVGLVFLLLFGSVDLSMSHQFYSRSCPWGYTPLLHTSLPTFQRFTPLLSLFVSNTCLSARFHRRAFPTRRIGTKAYSMYRCAARYGYRDLHKKDDDFEYLLFQSLIRFNEFEALQNSFGADSLAASWTPEERSVSSLPALEMAPVIGNSMLQGDGLENNSAYADSSYNPQVCLKFSPKRLVQQLSIKVHIFKQAPLLLVNKIYTMSSDP
ncbi:unnamed protein product [Sphagnum balticum]